MREIIFYLLILLLTLAACDKEKFYQPELIDSVSGNSVINYDSEARSVFAERDTIIISYNSGYLELFVGFNAPCCIEYSTNSNIINDTIYVEIKESMKEACNFICYYNYTFYYEQIAPFTYYSVDIPGKKTSRGLILSK